MLSKLDVLPPIVVVDRTPFSVKGDFVTTQDAGLWAHAFKLHDLETFLSGMIDLGYEVVDRWPVHERRFLVPLYPELNGHYWGFFFRLKGSGGFSSVLSREDSQAHVDEFIRELRINRPPLW
jgi:putative methyltransferase (TIGR04325 family)